MPGALTPAVLRACNYKEGCGTVWGLAETTTNSDCDAKRPTWRLPPWSWPVLVLLGAWAAILISIAPVKQDFPLGDDWAFARGALRFAQGEGIHYSKWASMPQLGQWLWSWPFVRLIGPPHFALRLSVIVLSWLGVVAFYDLLRQQKLASALCGFAACVLALNPYIFVSQGTYMTDIPALAFALMALSCYSRAIINKRASWLCGGVALAVLSGITRQTMIAVPIAAGMMLLAFPSLRFRPVWVLSMLLPIAVCACVSLWFVRRTDTIPMHMALDWRLLLFRPFLALHTCGLAVFPLLLATWRRERWDVFVAALLILLAAAFYVYSIGAHVPNGGLFPYCYGMITPWGTYSDGLVVGNRDILLRTSWRLVLTVVGCIGGAHILDAAAGKLRARAVPGILLWFTACQFLFILTMPAIMDRYLEVLFPGALALSITGAQQRVSKFSWWPALAASACSGLISVALLHDWLSWNTARWELGRHALVARGLKPADIEGGFEWNGWYASADPDLPIYQLRPDHTLNREPGLSLPFSRYVFPQVNGQFALGFTPPENSRILESLPYTLWLPPRQKQFFLVQFDEK